MNPIRRLQRNYDRLEVWERIPLLWAAKARGDESEYETLTRTAPPSHWRAPSYTLADTALSFLAMEYTIQQLDAAGAIHFLLLRRAANQEGLTGEELFAVEAYCHFYACNHGGWQAFCGGLGIDAATLIEANSESRMLKIFTCSMLAAAPGEERMRMHAVDRGDDPGQVVTVQNRTDFWRDMLVHLTPQNPPPARMTT